MSLFVSGVRTNHITAIPIVGGEFYLARFERTDTTHVKVTVVRLSNGDSEEHTFNGLSQVAGLDAVFFTRTTNGVAKTLDAEYWSGSFSGLSRV